MSKRRNHDAAFKYEEGQKMVWETIFPTIGVAVEAQKGERTVWSWRPPMRCIRR